MSSGSEIPSKRWHSRMTSWAAVNVLPLSNDRSSSPLTPKCSTNPDLFSSDIVPVRVNSLPPERERPVGPRVRIVQHDHEPSHAPDIPTGARPRLGGAGQPCPGRIRYLQDRALRQPRVVQEGHASPSLEQGA